MTVMRIVVVLAVTMIVRVTVVVIRVVMIMLAMIMLAVIVVIVMTMPAMAAAGISAAFGIERGFNDNDARTEAAHHVLNDVIAADTKAFADDLGRQMAVAKMPGDTHQMMRIGAANFHQRFRCCDHFDQPPIFQHQCIAAAQGNGFLQIQQKLQSARAGHRHPSSVPVVEAEDHRIGSGLGPANLRANLRRADHDDGLTASALRRR